jgi:hypothetical protein
MKKYQGVLTAKQKITRQIKVKAIPRDSNYIPTIQKIQVLVPYQKCSSRKLLYYTYFCALGSSMIPDGLFLWLDGQVAGRGLGQREGTAQLERLLMRPSPSYANYRSASTPWGHKMTAPMSSI